MFQFLSLILIYAFLSFGGVLPYSRFLLVILWLAGIAVFLIFSCIRSKAVDLRLVTILIIGMSIASLIDLTLGLWCFAIGWSWIAAHRQESQVIKFFHILLVIGILEAILGLTQYFFNPGWVLGFQNPTTFAASGTLVNRNHFAGILEMLIPVAFGLAYIGIRRYENIARSYVYLLAGALMGIALVFTLSRMGLFSFLMSLLFMGMILWFRRAERSLGSALALLLPVLVLAGALWIGVDVVVKRFARLADDSASFTEGRMNVFRDTLRMIADNPTGIGAGNYVDVFRQYQTFSVDKLFDHTHNDYLETAVEWGVPIAAAFWLFIFGTLFHSVRTVWSDGSPERIGILLACSGAIFSILVHSLVDFNLQIPSNAMLFLSFVGVASAVSLKTVQTE